MDRMLVVVFDSETRAAEAMRLLAALDDEQAITIYAAARVTMDPEGSVTVADSAAGCPRDALLAVPIQRLIDLLRRPATAGDPTVADLAAVGVEADFVTEVRQRFSPPSAAVVAEIEESWLLPVNVRMEQLGGYIMRRSRAPIADALNDVQLAVCADDVADMESEYTHTDRNGRAGLQESLTNARVRLQAARSMAQCAISTRKREAEAKIRVLREQAAKADADRRAIIARQIGAIRAEYVHWAARLHTVWQIPTAPLSL
jgi:uncharacterized membrane protein